MSLTQRQELRAERTTIAEYGIAYTQQVAGAPPAEYVAPSSSFAEAASSAAAINAAKFGPWSRCSNARPVRREVTTTPWAEVDDNGRARKTRKKG